MVVATVGGEGCSSGGLDYRRPASTGHELSVAMGSISVLSSLATTYLST